MGLAGGALARLVQPFSGCPMGETGPARCLGLGAGPCLAACTYVHRPLPGKQLTAHPHISSAPAGRPWQC